MAEKKSVKKKQQAAPARKASKMEEPQPAAERGQPKQQSTPAQKPSGDGQKFLVIGIIVLLAALIVYVVLFQLPGISGASFSSFKANFDQAPRIAVTVIYHNESQWPLEEPCYTRLLDVLSGVRGASSIDFFLVNQTSCTYSPTGLGHAANYITKNASSCLSTAQGEPGIYLNYSQTYNKTTITPDHLYINGNYSYYNSCPIATEFA